MSVSNLNKDWNAMDTEAFRAEVRAFFQQNYPEQLRYPKRRLRWDEIREWTLELSARGWLAPSWPQRHGGMGLTPDKLIAFIEEQERHGVARAPDMGITMVGPLLIQHGTDAQRGHYLPRILACEDIWCQGYSEPNSGSDLASLRTEAVADGDDFIVNGQKIWTTLAQDATHIFLLVRTDKTAKKQEGISFLLADMKSPGITVRPIRNIAGAEDFCEVFLDNVRVPRANIVGELNKGWTIAKALLGFERIFLGSPKQSQYALARVEEAAARLGLLDDPIFADRYTELALDVADLGTLYTRFVEQVKRGEALGPDVSMLKIFATETYSRLANLLVEIAGASGGIAGDVETDGGAVDVLTTFYNARPATIYGGSNEIQRNILASAVLQLPS
jgi:alkylation response protein AidB-like acyl-CoA dehydrogenase